MPAAVDGCGICICICICNCIFNCVCICIWRYMEHTGSCGWLRYLRSCTPVCLTSTSHNGEGGAKLFLKLLSFYLKYLDMDHMRGKSLSTTSSVNGLTYSAVCLPSTSHNGEREGGSLGGQRCQRRTFLTWLQPVRPSVATRRRLQVPSKTTPTFPPPGPIVLEFQIQGGERVICMARHGQVVSAGIYQNLGAHQYIHSNMPRTNSNTSIQICQGLIDLN